MTNDFFGAGWKFPPETDKDNRFSLTSSEDAESIRQAIWMILGTARGERVMRPDFGCGIHELVFAVNSAGTAGRVASEVRQALLQWEARIDVLNVSVSPDAAEPSKLLIEIEYNLRTTNSRFNVVYPFYLE